MSCNLPKSLFLFQSDSAVGLLLSPKLLKCIQVLDDSAVY